jgi:aminomethyltransferase
MTELAEPGANAPGANLPNAAPLGVSVTGASITEGYSALRERAAWLDLSGRGKIRVTGEDRARLLHAMTTNQVEKLQPGEGCYAFFLNAQGRILGDANLFCFEDHFLLDTEPETHEKLFEHLDRYIIADDVAIEDQTERICTIAVEGPEARATLNRLNAPIPESPDATAAWHTSAAREVSDARGPTIVARVSSTGSDGYFLIAPTGAKAELIAKLTAAGVVTATPEDAHVVRLEHGHPRYGEEITERYLVQETGQLQAVSFTKGCYLGQEIVERVRSRAQIHRVLRRVEIESAAVPAQTATGLKGSALKSGEAPAGEIVSAVFSPALGKIVALAYVRTPFAEPGTELSLDDAPARVVA